MSDVQKKSSRSLRVEFLGDMKKSDFFRVQDGEEMTNQVLPIVFKIAKYKIYALS